MGLKFIRFFPEKLIRACQLSRRIGTNESKVRNRDPEKLNCRTQIFCTQLQQQHSRNWKLSNRKVFIFFLWNETIIFAWLCLKILKSLAQISIFKSRNLSSSSASCFSSVKDYVDVPVVANWSEKLFREIVGFRTWKLCSGKRVVHTRRRQWRCSK